MTRRPAARRAASSTVARCSTGSPTISSIPSAIRCCRGASRARFDASLPVVAAGRRASRSTRFSRDFESKIIPGITHWNHPAFFGYFATSSSVPGILAEMLAATLDVKAMLWKTSPAATELEQVVTDWLRQMLGLERRLVRHHDRHRVDLVDARARRGARGAAGARDSRTRHGRAHGSAAAPRLLRRRTRIRRSTRRRSRSGLGLENVVQDRRRRRNFECGPTLLAAAIAADRAQRISAARLRRDRRHDEHGEHRSRAGDRGDLPARERLAARRRRVRRRARDRARVSATSSTAWSGADSLVVNPHKWLFTPFDCSVLYHQARRTC